MKTVLSPHDVAHYWANQLQDEGRNSGSSIYFHKNEIFSYGSHFMIAKHVENKLGEKAVLFTERKYSNTTSRHVSWVRQAASHLRIIFVPDPALSADELFESWGKELLSITGAMKHARKPEKYISEIHAVGHHVEQYANFFGLKIPKQLQVLMAISSTEDGKKALDKHTRAVKAEEKKQAKAQAEKHARELTEWRAFERRSMWKHNGWDYLRYNSETDRLETSQGVEIPVAIAKTAYKWMQEALKSGGCNGDCNYQIMRYNVSEVNAEYMQIGCHKFSIAEIEAIAQHLHFTAVAA